MESVPILGLEVCTRFSLVKKVGSLTADLSPRVAILCDYKDNFEGLRCMPQEYHIEIQKDATPGARPKYVLSVHGKVMETLSRWEKSGVASKVDQPTDT